MAIVIPRARSSGALSIDSNERYSASPFSASTFVIAAVSVVFPWSTCPIVPTFTCGFVRSNFFLAMVTHSLPLPCAAGGRRRLLVPTLGQHLARGLLRDRRVVRELHRVGGSALRQRAQVGRVAEHLAQRHRGAHHLRVTPQVHA